MYFSQYSSLAAAVAVALGIASPVQPVSAQEASPELQFERIATFPVYLNTDINLETAAEILDVSEDGNTLIYTDSPNGKLGFIDISDPANPQPAGAMDMEGEPTSVAVAGRYALVAINTSESFVNASGHLNVVDLQNRSIIARFDLGGQPDSIAVSPNGRFAAVVIENERDEDLNDGVIPQLPGGLLQVVTLAGNPVNWRLRSVSLAGLAEIAPEDPEPEYVDISNRNIAAITLQENNHLVYVNLRTGRVLNHYSAGAVNLDAIDTIEDDVIRPDSSLSNIKREPDAINWLNRNLVATANEGDYEGGSRGFSIFHQQRGLVFDSGNSFEHLAIRHGHYPESRSENKGAEPEGIEFGRYGTNNFLFVGSERGNFVAVYRLDSVVNPEFVQVLPVTNGPEGLKAIPERNLFVVASEVDDAGEGLRSTVAIFRLQPGQASYPTLISEGEPPIGWGALSALAGDKDDANRLYSVHDSYYKEPRIYTLDVSATPARITGVTLLKGDGDLDYDLEGIAQTADGGFWLASEGNSSRDNLLIRATADGNVMEEVILPESVRALKKNNGYEGVAVTGSGDAEQVYVAFQREWEGDPEGLVRIGRYTPATGAWAFYYYPLDAVESPAGGWVGLSELVALDETTFAVIERDNQRGLDAVIKRLYTFSLEGLTPKSQEDGDFPVVAKTRTRDILPELQQPKGWVQDKPEGLTVAADGAVYLVTDNDGIDDATGETQFLRLGNRSEVFGK